MGITLKHLSTGEIVDLGARRVWTDEFERSGVAMEARWGTTGALMLHVAAKQAGWPITLDGVESEAWLPRSTCQRLRAWADEPGQEFELFSNRDIGWDDVEIEDEMGEKSRKTLREILVDSFAKNLQYRHTKGVNTVIIRGKKTNTGWPI